MSGGRAFLDDPGPFTRCPRMSVKKAAPYVSVKTEPDGKQAAVSVKKEPGVESCKRAQTEASSAIGGVVQQETGVESCKRARTEASSDIGGVVQQEQPVEDEDAYDGGISARLGSVVQELIQVRQANFTHKRDLDAADETIRGLRGEIVDAHNDLGKSRDEVKHLGDLVVDREARMSKLSSSFNTLLEANKEAEDARVLTLQQRVESLVRDLEDRTKRLRCTTGVYDKQAVQARQKHDVQEKKIASLLAQSAEVFATTQASLASLRGELSSTKASCSAMRLREELNNEANLQNDQEKPVTSTDGRVEEVEYTRSPESLAAMRLNDKIKKDEEQRKNDQEKLKNAQEKPVTQTKGSQKQLFDNLDKRHDPVQKPAPTTYAALVQAPQATLHWKGLEAQHKKDKTEMDTQNAKVVKELQEQLKIAQNHSNQHYNAACQYRGKFVVLPSHPPITCHPT